MKIVQINGGVFGSTGSIMFGVSQAAQKNGMETLCFSPVTSTNRNKDPAYPYRRIGSYRLRQLNVLLSRITGWNGCFSWFSTAKILREIQQVSPDIVQLHNLHDSYINLPMLFRFLKKRKLRTIWTLHDCWSFTGHCPHFTLAGCNKWKTGCHDCSQYRKYPQSYVDNSRWMYRWKKTWFTGVEDMTIVTPSQWLADLVKESFLKEYPVKVIHNGIDLGIFKPTESDFRERYGIPAEKSILLGVAFGWGVHKGLDVFVELSRRLDSEKYQIVLVGTDEKTDKQLPENIISIHRTQNQTQLAEIYTAADLFINPTREEVLGMVNIESLACGTSVITFNTGGSPECIDGSCGSVVPCDDIDALEQEILRICTEKPFSQADCLERAKSFDMNERFQEYVDLYESKISTP